MSDCAEKAEDYLVIHLIEKQDLSGKVSSLSLNIGFPPPIQLLSQLFLTGVNS